MKINKLSLFTTITLMTSALLTGCTMDQLNSLNGFNVISSKTSAFDGVRNIHVGPGMVLNAEQGWTSNAFYLQGDWYSNSPDNLVITTEVSAIANIESLEANVDGVMKGYQALGTFTDFRSSTVSPIDDSQKAFAVPMADIKQWLGAKRVVLRVTTDKGALEGFFNYTSAAGQPTAKIGLAKLVTAIASPTP